MNEYRGERIDVARALMRLPKLARACGFEVTQYGSVADFPLYRLERAPEKDTAPAIYLSTGVHGDEPAGPVAVMRLLEEERFARNVHWTLFPMVNPVGLAKSTRENGEDIDVNRDYNEESLSAEARLHKAAIPDREYAVSLCLHEDWETTGFYCFELNMDCRPAFSKAIFEAVRQHLPIEPREEIDGHPLDQGLVSRCDLPEMETWPEAFLLVKRYSKLSYTLETPSNGASLKARATAQAAAVCAVAGTLGITFPAVP